MSRTSQGIRRANGAKTPRQCWPISCPKNRETSAGPTPEHATPLGNPPLTWQESVQGTRALEPPFGKFGERQAYAPTGQATRFAFLIKFFLGIGGTGGVTGLGRSSGSGLGLGTRSIGNVGKSMNPSMRASLAVTCQRAVNGHE